MAIIIIDSTQIHYIDNHRETDKVILFIHGNSHSSRTFRHQFQNQQLNEYRLIALDLPGHGDSGALNEYSLAKFTHILTGFVEQLDLKEIILVGHSLGGHIAIEAVSQINPKGIFIFGTPPLSIPLDMGGFKANKDLELVFKDKLSDSEVTQLAKNFYSKSEIDVIDLDDIKKTHEGFRFSMFQSFGAQLFQDEVKITNAFAGRKAFIHGTQDKLINANYLNDKIDLSGVWQNKIIEIDSSHNLHIENYQEMNALIVDFAASVFEFDLLPNNIHIANEARA
jgi:pimeloyl-ACP methyl ester carboxylesterase